MNRCGFRGVEARLAQRSSVAILRCRDAKINLARGRAAPDDLHLRGAVLTKKASPFWPMEEQPVQFRVLRNRAESV